MKLQKKVLVNRSRTPTLRRLQRLESHNPSGGGGVPKKGLKQSKMGRCRHMTFELQTKAKMGGADVDSLAKRVEQLERRVGSR